MRRDRAELTDEDLRRLALLGGGVDQIAEAAGIDVGQVNLRLGTPEPSSWDNRPSPAPAFPSELGWQDA